MPNKEDADIDSAIAKARVEYRSAALSEEMLLDSPRLLFEQWFNEAVVAGVSEPNAMALATTDSSGAPQVRYVLLKDISTSGLVFYTNSNSQKGLDLSVNPKAAVVFYWRELERQVRVAGSVTQVADEVADLYFASRPRGAQLGALASKQSQPLLKREELEAAIERLDDSGSPLKRPEYWKGYCIEPKRYEFWQGRESRLHDRFAYRVDESGSWSHQRLYP